jgi:hypothetical protein
MRFVKLELGLACAATLIAAAGAHAGVLVVSAENCSAETLSQPFTQWGDSNQYTSVPNGNFEAGTSGWSLAGGAGLAAGAEPWHVSNNAETSSLSLPPGSSATSAPMCIDVKDPTIRFFARNSGSSVSTLNVSVTVTTSLGLRVTLPIGEVVSNGSWAPSPAELTLVSVLALDTKTPVEFSFTPIGGDKWQIDDVFVDPFGRS